METIQKQKQKENEVKLLNGLNINICHSILCRRSNNEFHLDNNDYVFHGKAYYIKVGKYKSVESLIADSDFCDTFSEILSTVFMVNDHKNDFRYMLRNDLQDTEHTIINELGHEILIESKSLLGISDYFASFWSAILNSLSIELDVEIKKDNIGFIAENIGLDKRKLLSIHYSDIETNELSVFIDILEQLNIDIPAFNKHAFYKISLSSFHKAQFNNTFLRYQKKFKFLLWMHCTKGSETDKSKFIYKLGLYNHQDDWIDINSEKLDQVINVNYIDLVFSYVKELFLIDLETGTGTDGDYDSPDKLYKENIKSASIEDDADIPESIRCYLYFKDCLKLVQDYLDGEKLAANNIDDSDNDFVEGTNSTLPGEPSETQAATKIRRTKRSKKAGRHSSNSDKKKKEKGLKNEEIVCRALVAKHGLNNVIHKSLEDDTLGYDIAYSYDNGYSWKFVEVKSYSNSLFYLSTNERNFSEEHRDDYEVYLVDDDKRIFILKDVDFSDEDKFSLDVNDYVVSFELI